MEQRISIKKYLDKIKVKLSQEKEGSDFISFKLGEILFLSSYAPDALNFEKIEKIVELAGEDSTHSLCSGSLAVSYLIRTLCKANLLDTSELTDLEEDSDPFYRECIQDHIAAREYDLFTGLVGKGIYFLEANHAEALAEVVRGLDQIKTEKDFIYWQDPFHKDGKCDLGLAHGVPAILVFLSYCYKKGIEQLLCKKLAFSTIEFLFSRYKRGPKPFSFPSLINMSTLEIPATSRLAWCYGDLGMAIAICKAGQIFEQPEWVALSVEVMSNAAELSFMQSGVFTSASHQCMDTGFCHGTAGIAHLFNRFYQLTQIEKFRITAERWLDLSLNELDKEHNLFPLDRNKDIWEEHNSLLEGLGGVGMILLSFYEPEKHQDWDRIFLTDIYN